MATKIVTKIAINWLCVCVNDSDQAIGYGAGLSKRPTDCRYYRYLQAALKGRCHATTFWLSMGYNFGYMIARDTLFNSRGGFSGLSYPMKTQ